jgi:hypothetical protein
MLSKVSINADGQLNGAGEDSSQYPPPPSYDSLKLSENLEVVDGVIVNAGAPVLHDKMMAEGRFDSTELAPITYKLSSNAMLTGPDSLMFPSPPLINTLDQLSVLGEAELSAAPAATESK